MPGVGASHSVTVVFHCPGRRNSARPVATGLVLPYGQEERREVRRDRATARRAALPLSLACFRARASVRPLQDKLHGSILDPWLAAMQMGFPPRQVRGIGKPQLTLCWPFDRPACWGEARTRQTMGRRESFQCWPR